MGGVVCLVVVAREAAPDLLGGTGLDAGGGGAGFGNSLALNAELFGGDGLALLSSVFYAAYFLVTQQARRHMATLVYIWTAVASASLVLLGTIALLGLPLTGYPLTTYLAFLGAGLVSQVTGYFSVGYALGHLPASIVAPTMIAQPVLTMLLAIPLAGRRCIPFNCWARLPCWGDYSHQPALSSSNRAACAQG